jgi:hypothetical protein
VKIQKRFVGEDTWQDISEEDAREGLAHTFYAVECPQCHRVLSEEDPVEVYLASDGITLFSYTDDGHQVVQRFGPVVSITCPQ